MNPASRLSAPRAWLSAFRRALRYLRPHRFPLIIGLTMALGVSVFYTFSISSVIPLLKVMFTDHETLADWVHRAQAEQRLGIVIPTDVPNDLAGLSIDYVRPGTPAATVFTNEDRIVAIGDESPGSFEILARIARATGNELTGVRVVGRDGSERVLSLPLAEPAWHAPLLRSAVGLLPAGRDADARLYQLGYVMGLLVVVSLLGGLCRFANEGLVHYAVQRSIHDLRSSLADRVLRLPMWWHSGQSQGDTLGRFATDIAKVEVGLSTLFGKVIAEPLKAVGVLALTLAIDWRLLLVALVGLPIGAIVIRTFGRMVKRAQKRASASWGRLLDHLGERLDGIRVVKAYGMEAPEAQRFRREDDNLTRAQTHIELVDAATNPALEFLAMCAVSLFVLYGGTRVFAGDLEPHLFFAAVVCLAGMMDPVRKLGNVNNRLQAADVSAGRLFELLDLREEEHAQVRAPATEAAPPPPLALREAVEFDHVSFAYPGNPRRLVLREVCARVERGQVAAVVGPNGSGKTSLMSLLLRFYEPTSGCIRIDGRDIASLPLASLRGGIGLVTQDSVVFTDTLRANLAYGAQDVSEERIARAIATAHIEDFVRALRSTTDGVEATGLDAMVSARSLSGGQRQRIALARAILRDPPILVLDEATSQVDTESETRIQEALDDVVQGRTVFIIAHRYSTIARAGVILVLDEGRLVAMGRHDELLERSPFYAALCRTQFAHAH
ncbi:MAG: ABC transporter ATP-binding protein [Phycisphaerales bacterium]|nr:ABC transporter ATP-binding protein [Phycisphaerales bacterium]